MEINRMTIYTNLQKKLKFDMFNKEIQYLYASYYIVSIHNHTVGVPIPISTYRSHKYL